MTSSKVADGKKYDLPKINKMETNKQIESIKQIWFFERIKRIDKPLAKRTKKEKIPK